MGDARKAGAAEAELSWGRDPDRPRPRRPTSPARRDRGARQRGAAGRVRRRIQYLIGTRAQLLPVWRRWGVAAEPDPQTPDLINHSSFIFGITASGLRTTLYPSNGPVSWMVNDVPLLAAS